jgi:hypothetical protein
MKKIPFGEIVKNIVDAGDLESQTLEIQKYVDDVQFRKFLSMMYDNTIQWKIKKLPKDYTPLNINVHPDRAEEQLRYLLKDLELFREGIPFLEKRMQQKLLYILSGLHSWEVELLKALFITRKIKKIPNLVIQTYLEIT